MLLLYMSISFAQASYFPDTLAIKQIKTCNRCVELTEGNQVYAKLEPDLQKKDIFYFLDNNNQKRLTLKYTKNEKYYSPERDSNLMTVYFSAFDNNNSLVANLSFTFDTTGYAYLYFVIQTMDQLTIIGAEEYFGTTTLIYDRRLGYKYPLATLTKPLFTYSLDAEFQMSNPQELLYSMNPDVFYATLALNSNTDFFYSIDMSSKSGKRRKNLSRQDLFQLRKKVFELAEIRNIQLQLHPDNPSTQDIKAANQLISQRYQEIYGENYWDEDNQDQSKKMHQLINLGYDLILSSNLSVKDESAMLQFLIGQLD